MKDKKLAEVEKWLEQNEANYPNVFKSDHWLKQIIVDYHEDKLRSERKERKEIAGNILAAWDKAEQLIEKLKETILIKAGDRRVKLGIYSTVPGVDCRVISEELYHEIITQLEQEIKDSETTDGEIGHIKK